METLAILAGMAVLLFTGYASAATMTSGRPSAVLTRDLCMAVWDMAVPTGPRDGCRPVRAQVELRGA